MGKMAWVSQQIFKRNYEIYFYFLKEMEVVSYILTENRNEIRTSL